MQRPPGSTHFPYPTLFRSQRPLDGEAGGRRLLDLLLGQREQVEEPERLVLAQPFGLDLEPREHRLRRGDERPRVGGGRSEEHTSELQSLAYLVCRLLLEKK